MNLKIGDWVTGYSSGYYQVVGFGKFYARRDDYKYKAGEQISNMVNLKQGFTNKMKFKRGADACAEEWIKPVSEDIKKEIDKFWIDNPDKKLLFDDYTAVEKMGDFWYQMNIVKESIEFWEQEAEKLPNKITLVQFEGWFTKRKMLYDKQYGDSKKKKQQYFITTKVIPESIEIGKPPMYEKPQLIFGKK